MNPADDFWRDLRDAQDRAIADQSCVDDVKARMPTTAPSRGRAARKPVAIGAGLALAAGVAWAANFWMHRPRSLDFWVGDRGDVGQVGAWIAAPDRTELPLRFSDGTIVSLLEGSRARVAGIDANGAHLILERGGANASVVHRSTSKWRLDVGPFEVNVVGTRFDVGWNPDDQVLVLKLREGAVVVSGCFLREPRIVARGQTLRASCKQGRAEILETARSEQDLLPDVSPSGSAVSAQLEALLPGTGPAPGESAAQPSPNEPASSVDVPAPRARPRDSARASAPSAGSWQKLASAGKFREALALVEQSGFDAECVRGSGSDLVTLGDVARLAGDRGRARQAYMAAQGKLPGGGRASYGLGLLAFDQERDYGEAARWFEMYLREQPQGVLRREAEGRLMEAWQRAGERGKAQAVARDYLANFPDGEHAPLARQLIAR